MTWLTAPMQAWLSVGRAPAAALPGLISRRRYVYPKRGLHHASRCVWRESNNTCRICRANLTQHTIHHGTSHDTKRVLELARQAAPQQIPAQSVVKVTGFGKQMGLQVVWELLIRQDGACLQHIKGKELSFCSGTEGSANPNAWEVDDTGVPHMLELDDNEACLVTEWVKSGLWLSPGLAEVLDIQCLTDMAAELQGTELPDPSQTRPQHGSCANGSSEAAGSRTGSANARPSRTASSGASDHGSCIGAAGDHDTAVGSNVSSSGTEQRSPASLHQPAGGPSTSTATRDCGAEKLSSRNGHSNGTSSSRKGNGHSNAGSGHADAVSSQGSVGRQAQPYVVVAVRLKSGKPLQGVVAALVFAFALEPGHRKQGSNIVSQVRLCTKTWQPIAVLQPICGEVVTWHFRDWREWQPNFFFPSQQHQLTSSGGDNFFTATSVSIQTAPPLSTFVMPQPPLTPSDTHFDPKASPQVKAWHTRSGHVLVKPEIDGKVLGFMMLDTGASGLVIEHSVANQLDMHAFGEMFVTGMGGSLRCQFRRARTLQLGPVSIERPLFMEMSLAGVVAGAPGPVIGILGYDLFRRCVMQLPPSSHDLSNTPFQLSIHNPSTFMHPLHLEHRWQPLKMIANLPHMDVLLTVNPDSKPIKCLLMLDSGAGGVDAMFHSRAVKELGLVHSNKFGTKLLTGVGGSSVAGRQVKSAELHSIDLSDHQFNNIRCLFTQSDGLDHTLYSSGILCGDIMSRCTVLLDYARSRIMFVPRTSINT